MQEKGFRKFPTRLIFKLKSNIVLLSCLTLIICPSAYVLAAYEGAVFGVNNFGSNSDGLCCPGCSDLNGPIHDAVKVREALIEIGYSKVKLNQNKAVDGRDWQDALKDHVDPYGTDWADVVFYSGHGGRSCSQDWSRIWMGDYNSGERCGVYTDDIEFAEGGSGEEANVMILAACQTMHRCVWQGGGYRHIDGGNSGTQFTTYNGYRIKS